MTTYLVLWLIILSDKPEGHRFNYHPEKNNSSMSSIGLLKVVAGDNEHDLFSLSGCYLYLIQKAEEFVCLSALISRTTCPISQFLSVLDNSFIVKGYRLYIFTLRPIGASTDEECFKNGGKIFLLLYIYILTLRVIEDENKFTWVS